MAQVKTPTWATCPQSVCKKRVMGCEGDSVEDLSGSRTWTIFANTTNATRLASRNKAKDASRSRVEVHVPRRQVRGKLLPACDGN